MAGGCAHLFTLSVTAEPGDPCWCNFCGISYEDFIRTRNAPVKRTMWNRFWVFVAKWSSLG